MNRPKHKLLTIVSVAMIVFVFLLLVGGVILWGMLKEKKSDFTSERWKESQDKNRHQYIDSLEEQYKLAGMKRSEVDELLGHPFLTDKEGANVKAYEYRISNSVLGGWKVYRISFLDDVVVHAEITSEDW